MRVRVGVVEGTPAERRFIQVGHPHVRSRPETGGLKAEPSARTKSPEPSITRKSLKSLLRSPRHPWRFAVQEKQPNNGNLKALWDAHNRWENENGYGFPPAIWIDWVELEGPLTATQKRWKQRREVKCMPTQRSAVRTTAGSRRPRHGPSVLETGKPQRESRMNRKRSFAFAPLKNRAPPFNDTSIIRSLRAARC